MTHDPYGQPDDRPNLSKRPDPNAPPAGATSEPAGLGDPSQQAGWGDPAQPYSTRPDPHQSGGSPPWGAQPYSTQPYGSPPGYGSPAPYGSPPAYGSPPPFAPMYSPYAQPSQSNGLAIAALITGICGFFCLTSFVAIGLGIAGLNESKRTGVGRGLSIAGISLGAVWLALFVGLIIIGAMTSN